MKLLLMMMTMVTLLTTQVQVPEEPKQPETINEVIEYINTEFGYYYLSPDKLYSEEMILQYDYCIGLAYEGYIVEAYTECEEFTSITPEIREEFHDYLEDAFIECKELVDKTAVLHYIFFQ